MIKTTRLGTTYGGWDICLDAIPAMSTVIDAGLGEDISFSNKLISIKGVKVIGFDPTEAAAKYVASNALPNFTYVKKAITNDGRMIKMYRNAIEGHVSESINPAHQSVSNDFYMTKSVSITEIRKAYPDISLIKLDIEGAEYSVYHQCVGIPQICIEFHHHCIKGIGIGETKRVIREFKKAYYRIIANNDNKEVTFILC